jgi:4-diphosphocytidyl-2-C-methyl-D-erythritol kinase
MPTVVRSHSKINLGLAIGAPRADGYHALSTVYQTLELHDLVTVTARPSNATALSLTSNDGRVPTDSRNTAWKMAAAALEALGVTALVEIHIEKKLPVQGGMGAGSANAVAALIGLEAELVKLEGGAATKTDAGASTGQQVRESVHRRAGVPPLAARETAEVQSNFAFPSHWPAKRLQLAAQVGSDVPLFLVGGTVLGVDRGQEVFPLPDIEPVWCVMAIPEVGVSTPQAFRDWDALCAAEGLTPEASTDKLNELSRAYVTAFAGAAPAGAIPQAATLKGKQGAGSSGVLPTVSIHGKDLAGPSESALVRTGICSWIANDFERVVFAQQPSLREIKRLLAASGTPEAALHASLSGSGSALFGLYLARRDAEAACQRLRTAGVVSHLTRTLPRSAYWNEMLLPAAG